jgi:BirA family biotin operon repressor/biotin-[acetyl-CoA-carboxylase] ligase
VCEAAEALSGKKLAIKWVNDVLLDGKKICGILTEAVQDVSGCTKVVAGVGINFSTPEADFPEDLRQIAGSLFPEGTALPRERLINGIAERIIDFSGGQVLDGYKRRMTMLGQKITVFGTEETFGATAIDVDDIGQLVVKKDDGEFMSLQTGNISIRKVF